ncbi:MAG: PaaI family thioesterase [Myxococcota bacterium]
MTTSRELRTHYERWQNATGEGKKGPWIEKRRLATAMRRVIQGLIETDAPEKELAAAADALEAFGDRLEGHPQRHKYEGWAETSPAGNIGAFFDKSPIIGLSNPLAPPIRLEADSDRSRAFGFVNFGTAYEGPPGCLHGGWVAASFDEVLGFANSITGNPGMTACLTVQYKKPTPLYTDLRFEATVDRVEGRKTFTHCELFAGETLTAHCEGLFISVGPATFRDLLEKRRGSAD